MVQISLGALGRRPDERGDAPDRHGPADGEDEVGEEVLAQEHARESSKERVRPPTARRRCATTALLAGLLLAGACSGGDDGASPTSTTAPDASSTSTTVDPALAPFLIQATDLPGAYRAVGDIDDTITSFCANEDAAAGLRATSRSVAAFARDPAGASIVQLVFRFREGDAARFVQQAGEVLDRCSNVPDIRGLAFSYEPVTPEVEAALAGTDAHVARFGISAGNGSLTEELAVFHHGDIAHLVAVLAVDAPRAELDTLAAAAFRAAAEVP